MARLGKGAVLDEKGRALTKRAPVDREDSEKISRSKLNMSANSLTEPNIVDSTALVSEVGYTDLVILRIHSLTPVGRRFRNPCVDQIASF